MPKSNTLGETKTEGMNSADDSGEAKTEGMKRADNSGGTKTEGMERADDSGETKTKGKECADDSGETKSEGMERVDDSRKNKAERMKHVDDSGETKAKGMAYSDSEEAERKVTDDPAQDDSTDKDECMQALKEMAAELEEVKQIEKNHIKSLSLEVNSLKQIMEMQVHAYEISLKAPQKLQNVSSDSDIPVHDNWTKFIQDYIAKVQIPCARNREASKQMKQVMTCNDISSNWYRSFSSLQMKRRRRGFSKRSRNRQQHRLR